MGQGRQLESLDDATNPEAHPHSGPVATAPVMPQGRHSYDVVSKYELPQVPLAFKLYLVCALTAPSRNAQPMHTARTARMDQEVVP